MSDKTFNLEKYTFVAESRGVSDMHFQTGDEPQFRKDGDIIQLNLNKLQPEDINDLKGIILSDRLMDHYKKYGSVDASYEILNEYGSPQTRMRVSFAQCYEGEKVVCRLIPTEIPTIEKFNMPEVFKTIAMEKYGMVIVAGVTGSGKSTTIAAMINHINENKENHVVTLEDPIEFVHQPKKCIFTHREKNAHFEYFSDGLKTVLRQDPDVILVGEMRDPETMMAAMQAAETGHLVFATVHCAEASDVPERIISTFPENQQDQVRAQIANVGCAFVAQTLCKKKGGGRVGAYEILRLDDAARNLIKEKKSFNLINVMQTGRKAGMQTLTEHLIDLYEDELISGEEGLLHATQRSRFESVVMGSSRQRY